MNKDSRNLSLAERQMLVISEEQLRSEIYKRTQMHFLPDGCHNKEVN